MRHAEMLKMVKDEAAFQKAQMDQLEKRGKQAKDVSELTRLHIAYLAAKARHEALLAVIGLYDRK